MYQIASLTLRLRKATGFTAYCKVYSSTKKNHEEKNKIVNYLSKKIERISLATNKNRKNELSVKCRTIVNLARRSQVGIISTKIYIIKNMPLKQEPEQHPFG